MVNRLTTYFRSKRKSNKQQNVQAMANVRAMLKAKRDKDFREALVAKQIMSVTKIIASFLENQKPSLQVTNGQSVNPMFG